MLAGTGGYTRGYRSQLTKQQKQEFQAKFCDKSLMKGIAFTALHLAALFGFIYAAYWAAITLDSALLSTLVFVFCIIGTTRQMRALENIVHFGSHHNFSRNKALNDWLTNVLAAWPMLQEVAPYRQFHLAHHGDYGSDEDPCRARLKQIGVPVSRINSNAKLLMVIARWFPLYVREYYREISSSKEQLTCFALWHFIVTIIAAIVGSPDYAIFQMFFFLICLSITLPLLRSIAEISEHDYERGDSVRDTTFNNLGWLDHVLIHPAGDAWHALHHLHPTVSWWKQRAAHTYLLEYEPSYANALHRLRIAGQNRSEVPVLE